jgi:hypothetical protein
MEQVSKLVSMWCWADSQEILIFVFTLLRNVRGNLKLQYILKLSIAYNSAPVHLFHMYLIQHVFMCHVVFFDDIVTSV